MGLVYKRIVHRQKRSVLGMWQMRKRKFSWRMTSCYCPS